MPAEAVRPRTGRSEGVAGPEAADNAAFPGVLVPLLTIGIPTSATARDLLTAAILVFATLGDYSVSGSVTEVLVMYVIGAAVGR